MVAANRLCLTCGTEYSGFISVCPEDQTRLTVLTQDERVGTVLADRYDILEIIGTGGMGTVYKARQRLINRIVAVKMLHKTMMTSADVLRRFQLEAQAASRLSLPNILTIYDFGLTEEGQPYMVMDYLNGTSLDKIIASDKHVEPLRALNIFIQACAALSHAHNHGVLHRDIKPSNIMLVNFDDQSDFVKIVDFGIAKMMNKIEGQAAELTKTGEVYGSPPYMSPEQCRGIELDRRADIYSLACVLYKSLVGKNPMQSTGDGMPLQIMLKHINDTAPSFAEAAPDLFLPRKLEEVVFKALEKSPDDRYQTMLEFKEALEKIRDSLVGEKNASQLQALDLKSDIPMIDVRTATIDGSQNLPLSKKKQMVDDPTPQLPLPSVPAEQQLAASASESISMDPGTQWPQVSQAFQTLQSGNSISAATPTAEVVSQPPHNLSPSEFLSTLNSQLTQSAQSVQVGVQTPTPTVSAQAQVSPAPVSPAVNVQQQLLQAAHAVQPLAPLQTQFAAPPQAAQPIFHSPIYEPVSALPAQPQFARAEQANKLPSNQLVRTTVADAVAAAQTGPETQMLSIVQAPQAVSQQTFTASAVPVAANTQAPVQAFATPPGQPFGSPSGQAFAAPPVGSAMGATNSANIQGSQVANVPPMRARQSQQQMPPLVTAGTQPPSEPISASILDQIKTPQVVADSQSVPKDIPLAKSTSRLIPKTNTQLLAQAADAAEAKNART